MGCIFAFPTIPSAWWKKSLEKLGLKGHGLDYFIVNPFILLSLTTNQVQTLGYARDVVESLWGYGSIGTAPALQADTSQFESG